MRHPLAVVLLSVPLLAFPPTRAQTADEKKATIAYLLTFEDPRGGFTYGAKSPRLGVTNACVKALHYCGGKPGDVAACKKFVLSCHDPKTGGFADRPGGKPDAIQTSLGLMAMVELKMPTDKVEKPAIAFLEANAKSFEEVRMAAAGLEPIKKRSAKNAEWVAELKRRQNKDETFGKGKALAHETGSAVACLLRLGGKVRNPKAVVVALDSAQMPDGGFAAPQRTGADLGTTYRVLRTYKMLGAKPARANDLRRYIAKCRNANGGYGTGSGVTASPSGTYYATIILHWLDQP